MKKIIQYTLISLLLVYSFLGFILLPYAIQFNFTKQIKTNFQTFASVSNIHLNPFTFELEIKDLLFKDKQNNTLAYFEELYLDIDPTKLIFDKEFFIKNIVLDSFQTTVIKDKDGKFNFDFLISKNKEEKTEEKKTETSTKTDFRVGQIYLKKNQLTFIDNGKKIATDNFNIEINNITSKNEFGYFKTAIDVKEFLDLKINSRFNLTNSSLKGETSISKLNLENIFNYLKVSKDFTIKGNNAEISLKHTIDKKQILITNIDGYIPFFSCIDKTKKQVDLSNINIEIEKYIHNPSFNTHILTTFDTPNSNTTKIDTTFTQEPFDLKTNIILDRFNLVNYNPYVKEFINGYIKKANLNGDINVAMDKDKKLSVTSNLSLKEFALNNLSNQTLFSFSKLDLKDVNYQDNLSINLIHLDSFKTNVAKYQDSTINLANIIKAKREKVKEQKQSKGEKEVSKPFQYQIDNINLTNSFIDFKDKTLPLEFITNLNNINIYIKNISSKPTTTNIDIQTSIDNYANAKILGDISLPNYKKDTKIDVLFTNINTVNYSPFSAKFIGSKVKEGKIWVDSSLKIKNSELSSKNNIKIKRLTIGEEVKGQKQINLPLNFAIALLEDGDGLIDVDIPVHGDFDNPKFELGSAIWTAVGNMITKVVTSPFSFLASVIGIDSDDLGDINFEFGSSDIALEQKEKLDNLTKALSKKPSLALFIPLIFNEREDTKVLVEKQYKLLVESNQLDDSDKLEEYYINNFGEDSIKDIEDEKINTVLLNNIKQNIQVSKFNLENLAKSRADSIKKYIIAKNIDSNRILIASEVTKTTDKNLILKLEVKVNEI